MARRQRQMGIRDRVRTALRIEVLLEHISDCDYRKPDALLPLKAKVGNAIKLGSTGFDSEIN